MYMFSCTHKLAPFQRYCLRKAREGGGVGGFGPGPVPRQGRNPQQKTTATTNTFFSGHLASGAAAPHPGGTLQNDYKWTCMRPLQAALSVREAKSCTPAACTRPQHLWLIRFSWVIGRVISSLSLVRRGLSTITNCLSSCKLCPQTYAWLRPFTLGHVLWTRYKRTEAPYSRT
jgi:hypothetical protein